MTERDAVTPTTFDDYLLKHAAKAFFSGPALRGEVVARLPRLLARMVACRAMRAERAKRGLHTPALLFLAVTGICNLRCGHCYTRGYRSGHMDLALARRILTEAHDLGVSTIVVSGGEPLLHREFFDLVRAMPNVPFIVFSNGKLVPAFVEDGLASPNMLWSISVDGPREANDARRGEGTYQIVCEAMAALKSQGLPFGFAATLAGNNVVPALSLEFVTEMAERGSRTGFVLEQIPSPPADPPVGRQISARLAAVRQKSPIPLIGFPADEPLYGGCQAGGKGMLHISPEGAVEPCPASRVAVNSLTEVSLAEALANPFLRDLRRKGEELSEDAQPCHHVGDTAPLQAIMADYGARVTG